MRSATVELHLSLVEYAGGFPIPSVDSLVNSILNQRCTDRSHCLVPGKRTTKTEHRVLINKTGMSLEVTMSGLVINPQYSWLGASLEGVVYHPGCTDPNEFLKSSALIITVTASLFKQHPRRGFVVSWKRVSLLRTPPL